MPFVFKRPKSINRAKVNDASNLAWVLSGSLRCSSNHVSDMVNKKVIEQVFGDEFVMADAKLSVSSC